LGLAGGFELKGNTLHINPDTYVADFVAGSGNYAKVRKKLVDPNVLELVKRKYRFIWSWLEVPKGDALNQDFKSLAQQPDLASLRAAENALKAKLKQRYKL
jgi:hypothetical protein